MELFGTDKYEEALKYFEFIVAFKHDYAPTLIPIDEYGDEI